MNLMPQVFVCWRMRHLVSVQSIWCIQLIHLCIGQCLFSHFKILFEALVDSHSNTDRFYPTIWTFLVLLKVLFLHKFKTLLIFMHTARPVACFSRQALQMHAPMHTNYVIGTGLRIWNIGVCGHGFSAQLPVNCDWLVDPMIKPWLYHFLFRLLPKHTCN